MADAGAHVLVIGYGNPLRCDDGLGWYAARLVEQTITSHDVQVLVCHQLTPELVAAIVEAERVIFIDAHYDAAANCQHAAARVRCQPVAPDPSAAFSLLHHLTPSALLACAQLLYGTCPHAVVCSITCANFGYGEELSPAVLDAIPTLLERIQQLITNTEVSHV